jgi:AcrR family transcriptional regulator
MAPLIVGQGIVGHGRTAVSLDASAKNLRELKRSRTRAAIRAHAMRLFLTQGYEETTVEQISAEAEVSPSTFFRYFTTKEAVVFADDYDDLIAAAFERQPGDISPPRALADAMREVTASLSKQELAALWERNRLVHSIPALRAAVATHLEESFVGIREAAARRSGLHPEDFAVRVFVGAMQGIWMKIYFQWGDRRLSEMVEYMASAMELVEGGLSLSPQVGTRAVGH